MTAIASAPKSAIRNRPRFSFDFVGLLPFTIFILVFLVLPAFSIVLRAVTDASGTPTLENIAKLSSNQTIVIAYRSSLQVSVITAISGAVIGGLLAWAITLGKLPEWIRNTVLSFSGVAANFAGVPLVFAFTALFGRLGMINTLSRSLGGGALVDPQQILYNLTGLCIVYTYFQIPLMVLILTPALNGLRKEWREAAENLGATQAQYWRYVAFPILTPALFGALALLFVNAFSTYATAIALLGAMGQTFAVTVVVANQFRTDTFGDPGLGYALAFSMMIVIAATVLIYTYSRRRAEQWLRIAE